MAGESEKSDPKGRFLVKISTHILVVAFALSLILFKSHFKSPWLIVWAFLQPASQNGIAMVFSDEIRSSAALQMLCWILSLTTLKFALNAEASIEALVLISSIYIVWGGLFQIGLGLRHLRRLMPLNHFYGALMMTFLGLLLAEKGLVWAWLYLVPISLNLGMFLLSLKFSGDFGAGDPVVEVI